MVLADLTEQERCDVFLEVAQWLERRQFAVTTVDGASSEEVRLSLASWRAGYDRAAFELRSAVANTRQFDIPDDASELCS